MVTFSVSNEFFNVKDTLECGQVFRFAPYKNGYKIYSADKCAYVYNEGDKTYICCNDSDKEYFYRYFDLDRDYKQIYNNAQNCEYEILKTCSKQGKGIRILNQDKLETLFSFIVSQNNNIPRIKGIIEKLCKGAGKKCEFMGEDYYAFPTPFALAEKPLEFFSSVGLGYRAPYILRLAKDVNSGFDLHSFNNLSTKELKKSLLGIYGVGPKVADCVCLFGFHRSDSFPVDTWIEKVYHENFNGVLTDRNKITDWFTSEFKDDSGYFQQYLFYYKRSIERE